MKKICSKCNKERLVEEFYFRDKQKGVRHKICKTCSKSNSKSKNYYLNHKDKYQANNQARQEIKLNENRVKLLEYQKINPCVDCGNDNPIVLEFDHLNQEEKKYNISSMLRDYKWERILDEINKCESVCANCHRIRTAKQLNWYKYTINE